VVDLWDGFGLWLAVHEPDACRLLVSASSERYRSLGLLPAGPDGGTMALVGDDGLAVLVPLGTATSTATGSGRFPVAVRPCGPGGEELADVLALRLREWVDAARPGAVDLQIRVHPGPGPVVDPRPGVATLCKGQTWLEMEWPGVRAPIRPKVGR
jgi:protein-L-isoaspartate(D-aspartate) O-methyltransferase